MKHLLSIIAFTINSFNYSTDNSSYLYISLPGLGGDGCRTYEMNKIVTEENVRLKHLEPLMKNDFGQQNCIDDFKNQLKRYDAKHVKLILCGASQGTATMTNYVAQLSHTEQEKKIGGLVLEGVLGHGKSAILHTAQNIPIVTYLPFSRFWIPRIGNLIFYDHNFSGMQAIESAKKISPNIPVIIMHHKNDHDLSINDARQLYCNLKSTGNDSAYLIEVNNKEIKHLDILNTDNPQEKAIKINAIQAMYKKHNLPHTSYENIDEFDLTPYTPSTQEVEKRIYDSTWKSRYLRNSIDFISGSALLAYLGYKYFKVY